MGCAKAAQLQLIKQTYPSSPSQKPHVGLLAARLRNTSLQTAHEKVCEQVTLGLPNKASVKNKTHGRGCHHLGLWLVRTRGTHSLKLREGSCGLIAFNKWYREDRMLFLKGTRKETKGKST